MAKTIAIKSFGCRTNQEEIASLSFRLAEQGHHIVDKIDEAEIVIVNTCCVTSCTEAKTRRLLHQISQNHPQAKICVTGCLAQQKVDELSAHYGARWVVGNTRKNDIPSIVNNEQGGVFWEPCPDGPVAPLPVAHFPVCLDVGNRTRFSIKIQEGCNFRCAYCIVPIVRGHSRSALLSDVIRECRSAVAAGIKEIVLTGTHIGQYRSGMNGDLFSLLENLIAVPGDFRVRLSSLDPRDLSEPLFKIMETSPKVCRHLHVSVQSLSREVLARMDRPGACVNTLVERLRDFRNTHPDVGIGGDFIVGFPGESTEMFEESISNLQKAGFSYGHVFRYSKRPSTAAYAFKDQIADKEKNRRSARMREVLDKGHRAFIERLAGTSHRIIVETENPATGVSSNYLRMELPGVAAKRNSWLSVTLTGSVPQRRTCIALVQG